MKLYGLFGKGSGKLGSSVFAISSGEQIVREYNPVVENPNTPAQVEQRAKFKLLSQLAASLASIIVIPKQGLVSSRNRFIGYNMPAVTYAVNTASVELAKLTITGGARPIGGVQAIISGAQGVDVNLTTEAESDINAVVYIFVRREDENGLRVIKSFVKEREDNNNNFRAEIEVDPTNCVLFAYGIVGNVAGALASYDNVEAPTAELIAKIVAERSIATANIGFTKTVFSEVKQA